LKATHCKKEHISFIQLTFGTIYGIRARWLEKSYSYNKKTPALEAPGLRELLYGLSQLKPTTHSEFGVEWGADADIVSRMRIREIFGIE